MTSCYSVVVDLGEMRYLGEGGVPPDVLQEFILRESESMRQSLIFCLNFAFQYFGREQG